MNQLDPNVKIVWSLRILIRLFFINIILFIADFFIFDELFDLLPKGWIEFVFLVFAIAYSIIFTILKYKYWAFDIREKEIYIEYGVITKISTIAPYSRIQHIDVRQGLFERMLSLSHLVIYTAGTRGADIVIPGLPFDYAVSLRDNLKNFTPDDAV